MPAKFKNPWPHDRHGIGDIIRWKLRMGKQEQPQHPQAPDLAAPSVTLDPASVAFPPQSGWRITWLGHSSFLIQGAGKSLLIDPIFSSHCSPLPFPGLRRMARLPCGILDLPDIDAILLSHSHYDHMDIPTLRKFGVSIPLFTPSGHSHPLSKKGFRNITEVSWWDSARISPAIRLTAVPAQHFTARTPFDRDRAHWCGWVIESDGCRIWHAGDTGYCPAFAEIGKHFGGIDFAMIPIGAYQPRSIMRAMHMNPQEAVTAFLDAGCKAAVAMHWGTFRLTDEPMGEPPILLEAALAEVGLAPASFVACRIGEILEIDSGYFSRVAGSPSAGSQ